MKDFKNFLINIYNFIYSNSICVHQLAHIRSQAAIKEREIFFSNKPNTRFNSKNSLTAQNQNRERIVMVAQQNQKLTGAREAPEPSLNTLIQTIANLILTSLLVAATGWGESHRQSHISDNPAWLLLSFMNVVVSNTQKNFRIQ